MKSSLHRYLLTAAAVALIATGCDKKIDSTAKPAPGGTPAPSPTYNTTPPKPAPKPESPKADAPKADASKTSAAAPAAPAAPTAAKLAFATDDTLAVVTKDTAKEIASGAAEKLAAADNTAAPAVAAATSATAAVPPKGTGVFGKVTFSGPAPKRSTVETAGDPKCAAMHEKEPLLSDRTIVGADGGVQWVFAYIKNPPDGTYPAPDQPAQLNQTGCRYTPHVLGIRVGQKLNINNNDPLLHNVRAIARSNKPINFAQPEGTPPRERIFDQPEMEIKLKCDVHSWMTGYLFVMTHPFYGVSDEHGQFSIAGLPAGNYTLVIWHEALGSQEVPVVVKDGTMTETNVTLKPAA